MNIVTLKLILKMNFNLIILILLIHLSYSTSAQIQDTAKWFDFWLGEWEVSWQEGAGKTGKGTNTIRATLDGKVIEEQFRILEGQSKGFKGTSISVFNPLLKVWHQAWADNQGGYYDFIGSIEGDNRIFQTAPIEMGGKQVILRMVFHNIKPDSFIWDWESTEDEGNNWTLNWRIRYKRKSNLQTIISRFPNVRDFCVSKKGTEAYFTSKNVDESNATIIKIAGYGKYWFKTKIAPFSGKYNDLEPFLTPDGLRLFFSSDRPINALDTVRDYDIWYVERPHIDSVWSAPINLGFPVNTLSDEFYPSLSANNNLYFTCDCPNSKGKDDVYFSEWNGNSYMTPISLSDSINSVGYEYNAFIAPDESYLIFGAYKREDGYGSGDLYISYRSDNGSWSNSENLGMSINSKWMDYCPFVDTRTHTLYFTSKRIKENKRQGFDNIQLYLHELNKYENGMSRIYSIPFHINK